MRYLNYVNVKQGTDSLPRFSNGNTLPLTQLPFAMAGFAPQTKSNMDSWFYHPKDRSIEGIRLTHQPSPWMGEYGAINLLPQIGTPKSNPDERWSSYRPEEALLEPHYMKLRLLRYRSLFELTPTERGCAVRISFEGPDEERFLSVLPVGGMCEYRFNSDQHRLEGFTTVHRGDDAKNFHNYFVIQFNEKDYNLEKTKITKEDGSHHLGWEVSGEKTGIHIALNHANLEVKMAISYISIEQAVLNLDRELLNKTFDQIQEEAEGIWESYLRRIEVETETEDQMTTFYSCMYRMFLFPRKCYELDSQGKEIHYAPRLGEVRDGLRYADTGFWDTYRTNFPLLSIIGKEEYAHMLEGFIQDYVDGGWLPRWTSIGEAGCMPSTLIDAVIADAAVKNIVSHDLLKTALEGMIHHANTESEDKRYGRNGVKGYLKYGYVPNNLEHESVNLTLDAAYGDFCIAEVAKVLGMNDIEKEYRPRALNYRNLFDPTTGFMRGRDEEGNMKPNFNPIRWGGEYTEGCAWQSSFAVPHDFEGLAQLYGGQEQFVGKLDELFATEPDYYIGGYWAEIHEMSEMAAVDFGQCAISNQPSFHIPYLYAAFQQPEKTNYWVEKMCNELFSWKDDGFPGDEDNGSMSAWYIFSNLGLYPLCPGKPEYIKSKMLVKSAKVNGKVWDHSRFGQWIGHNEI